jgi:uncharacterized protein YegP (UPF0339 family)
MVAQFEICQDKAGKYRWRLKSAGNWKVIADSGEGYDTKTSCEEGVNLVKKEASTATLQYL